MARSHLALVAWLVLGLGLGLRSANADDLRSSPSADGRCDELLGQTPSTDVSLPPDAASPDGPAGALQAAIPPPPGPPPAAQPRPSAPAAAPVSPPSLLDRWPIEYVLRPQTLPDGMFELGLRSSAFRPQSGPLTTAAGTPYTYNPYLALGIWARLGLTERFEAAFSAPRILCFADSDPSGCNDINRYNGTGPSAAYGVFRSRAVQLKVMGSMSIARSSQPLTWAWDLGARTKLSFGRVVALEMALDFSRRINPGSSQTDPSTRSSFVLDSNLQATRHLLVFFDLNPYAPVDRLDEMALELFGGASWTFGNLSEIHASAGSYNVLARRSWDNTVPGTFYVLLLLFWF